MSCKPTTFHCNTLRLGIIATFKKTDDIKEASYQMTTYFLTDIFESLVNPLHFIVFQLGEVHINEPSKKTDDIKKLLQRGEGCF